MMLVRSGKVRSGARLLRRRVLPALVVSNAVVMCACACAGAAPTSWDKGFNFVDWSSTGYASPSAGESLERLRTTGANAIALIPTWYQASPTATTIAPDPRRSPTDESIASIVALAKARNLKVLLRPVVDDQGDTARLQFAPTSPRAWFESYRAFINHYAELAQTLGADMLSVGHEYHNLDGPQYEAEWRATIAGVRERFRGPLTYGANNADAWTHIRFWDALDIIGIDAYFTLSTGPTPDVGEIVARWHTFTDKAGVTHHYLDEMAALSAQHRKPIVFTEIGYPSAVNALVEPWLKGTTYSGEEQERALRAAFQALAGEPWCNGLYIWDWSAQPSAGGPGDTAHTPQNKPAEATVREWFTSPPSPTRRARGIRLVRASVRNGVLTVQGTLGARVEGRVRVVYGVRAKDRLIRRVRRFFARRGRFAARFALPAAVRTPDHARRGTLLISYNGRRGTTPNTARLTIGKLLRRSSS
jgi:hypothetical protein